jgi:U3 small nucleolar RNA-associated protein 14
MDFDSSDNSDAHYSGKIKTKTFKELQLERLIKEGKVMPASKLAEAKELELTRAREFEVAAEDEARHKRAAVPAPDYKLKNLPLTRERFED